MQPYNKYNSLILSLFLLLISSSAFSQEVMEYVGILKLNDTATISYKINAKFLSGGIVKGYSITDLGGKYETKSTIVGKINKSKKEISFKETDIIYTKSEVKKYDFCFVNFNGNIKGTDKIKGKFKGLYKDGTSCLDGEILLVNAKKIAKMAAKYDIKIQKSKKFDAVTKSKVYVEKAMDSLNVNILKENENVSFFAKSNTIKIKVYDPIKEDGDRIAIHLNKVKLFDNIEVLNKEKVFTVELKNKESILEIEALNEGEYPPNTANFELIDEENSIKATTTLKKGKRTKITLIML
jgi:hypothetical protein